MKEIVETPRGRERRKQLWEFNENLLQELARETEGRYFNVKNKGALKATYASIDQLGKSTIKRISYQRTKEKFLPWVTAATAFLFMEAVLSYTVFRKFP